MKFGSVLLFLFFCFSTASLAQTPKRELRAAWIATVANIDWPGKQGLPAIEQQQQFIERLDKLKELGCNAVIVQVRPCSDACYPSEIEPWSQYISGKLGQAPYPYYDPLLFMIEETHKRNMEFHAWFNPFRASMNCKVNAGSPKHVTCAHKNWVVNYGGKSYIDPGVPEAREYVLNIISDVVKRYDIDAVHLDDYFYPYRIGKTPFGDNKSYTRYGEGMNRDNWRRNNVNLFIAQLHTDVKQIKPYIKIGVSPFGVWRNIDKDPVEGSDTHAGQTCFDDLYADVLLWMKKGWIDYLMPQLYWSHTNHAASFSVLLSWWTSHVTRGHVYYGLGVYQVSDKNGKFGLNELLWQIRDIRKTNSNLGYSFYSARSFDKLNHNVRDSIAKTYAKYPAFPPVMRWIDSIPPAPPVAKEISNNMNILIQWSETNPQKEALKYVVYRFASNEEINLERTDKIVSIQQQTEFTIPDPKQCKHSTFVVTALDRLWNESKASNKVTIE